MALLEKEPRINLVEPKLTVVASASESASDLINRGLLAGGELVPEHWDDSGFNFFDLGRYL